MEMGKCGSNGDIKITLEDLQIENGTKVTDESINIKWKVKTKVIESNPVGQKPNYLCSILSG